MKCTLGLAVKFLGPLKLICKVGHLLKRLENSLGWAHKGFRVVIPLIGFPFENKYYIATLHHGPIVKQRPSLHYLKHNRTLQRRKTKLTFIRCARAFSDLFCITSIFQPIKLWHTGVWTTNRCVPNVLKRHSAQDVVSRLKNSITLLW